MSFVVRRSPFVVRGDTTNHEMVFVIVVLFVVEFRGE